MVRVKFSEYRAGKFISNGREYLKSVGGQTFDMYGTPVIFSRDVYIEVNMVPRLKLTVSGPRGFGKTELLRRIKDNLPKYVEVVSEPMEIKCAMGNHDYFQNMHKVELEIEETG